MSNRIDTCTCGAQFCELKHEPDCALSVPTWNLQTERLPVGLPQCEHGIGGTCLLCSDGHRRTWGTDIPVVPCSDCGIPHSSINCDEIAALQARCHRAALEIFRLDGPTITMQSIAAVIYKHIRQGDL